MQLEILNALKNVNGKVKCPRIQPMLKMCQILELENLFDRLASIGSILDSLPIANSQMYVC